MNNPQDQRNPTTVLLVDDYPFMRLILRNILEKGGYRVIAESNCCGDEAMDKYLRYRPAITVVDTTGRRQSGLEVATAIFDHDAAAAIVLCDFDVEETSDMAKEVSASGILVKPYSIEQVLTVMEAVRETIRKQ